MSDVLRVSRGALLRRRASQEQVDEPGTEERPVDRRGLDEAVTEPQDAVVRLQRRPQHRPIASTEAERNAREGSTASRNAAPGTRTVRFDTSREGHGQ